ncbi:MAG: hypothetical protein HQ488_01960 [Parcubacteria group bacterium]|nr:hypothetical protein [Parcubacteria group bacterium]
MPTQRVKHRPPATLSAEQKVAFAILMFLGFGGVVLGFFSFGANLDRPIQKQIAEMYTGQEFLTSSDREARELEESKSKDTDGDGLVDYDELYVYKTSPYLSDSDSDGFDDKSEVFSGNNPNCPTGTDCFTTSGASENVDGQTGVAAGLIGGLGEDSILAAGAVKFDSQADVENFFKQATIEQIRSALVDSGMSEVELSEIDDETLQEFFYTVVDDANDSGAFEELIDQVPLDTTSAEIEVTQ